jgi:hypothetical protein
VALDSLRLRVVEKRGKSFTWRLQHTSSPLLLLLFLTSHFAPFCHEKDGKGGLLHCPRCGPLDGWCLRRVRLLFSFPRCIPAILDWCVTFLHRGVSKLEKAKKAIGMMVQQKILFTKRDEMGLVLVGSKETDNALNVETSVRGPNSTSMFTPLSHVHLISFVSC